MSPPSGQPSYRFDDPLFFLYAQRSWNRELAPLGALSGIWDGTRAAWTGARLLAGGAPP